MYRLGEIFQSRFGKYRIKIIGVSDCSFGVSSYVYMVISDISKNPRQFQPQIGTYRFMPHTVLDLYYSQNFMTAMLETVGE